MEALPKITESPERCNARLSTNGKRCPNESIQEVPFCNKHVPEGTEIARRYSKRLAPTFKKVFDGYAKSPENPHDLTAEVALMRTLLEQSIDVMNQAAEKGDAGLILTCQRYLKQTINETAQIVERSATIQQKYEKMIPAKMVAAVVYQLIQCVKIATNNDERILTRLMTEINKVRLPQQNMVVPEEWKDQNTNSQKECEVNLT